jgi:hypothetical protein
MPTFLYRAFDVTTRNALEGSVDAESLKLARALLRSRGFTDVSDLIGGYSAWQAAQRSTMPASPAWLI